MKSFDEVLGGSPEVGEMRFNGQAGQAGAVVTELVPLDDSNLPAPVSSFEHVARSTASRQSLVPPKPIWPFGLRAHPHRQAS